MNALDVKDKFWNIVGCVKIVIISFSVKNVSKTKQILKVCMQILTKNIML